MCAGPVNIKQHLSGDISPFLQTERNSHHWPHSSHSFFAGSWNKISCKQPCHRPDLYSRTKPLLFGEAKGNISFLIISIPEFSRMETWGLKVSVRWPHNRSFICRLRWKTHHSLWLSLWWNVFAQTMPKLNPPEIKTSLSEKCYMNTFSPLSNKEAKYFLPVAI